MPGESDFFLFVSHVAEDRAAALEVVDELERRGVKCWIAPRDVHPGRPFDDEIVDAIEGSRAMLLIFSDHCNESDYIRREVTVAGESHKLVIPFRIEDVPPRRGLRVRLSDLHWIDGFASRERGVDQVIRTVDPEGVVERDREAARRAQEEERAKQGDAERQPEEARREAETVRQAEGARQAEAQRAEEARREAEAAGDAAAARKEAVATRAAEQLQADQRRQKAATAVQTQSGRAFHRQALTAPRPPFAPCRNHRGCNGSDRPRADCALAVNALSPLAHGAGFYSPAPGAGCTPKSGTGTGSITIAPACTPDHPKPHAAANSFAGAQHCHFCSLRGARIPMRLGSDQNDPA